MIMGTRMKWTTTVKAIGQGDGLNCARRRRSRISNLRHSLEMLLIQFQLLKTGKKVSWKRLDCQDELHRSMTYNKFTTLTPGEEEQEFDEVSTSNGGSCFFALNTAVQETCAKRKVNTKKNIDMLVKVRESPVGRPRSPPMLSLHGGRVSIAIDSVCDSVISPEHVPDHEVHESVEVLRR